jgi:hypothetical protein
MRRAIVQVGPGAPPIGRGVAFGRGLSATVRNLPVLVAIAVTVIIAGLALITVHRGSQSAPATSAIDVRATRQQLIQMLDVLRSPQTKADQDLELTPGFLLITEQLARRHQRLSAALEHYVVGLGVPKLDRALARVVTIPAWHAKVGIEPATWRPSPSSPQRSEGVYLEMWVGSKSTIPPSSDIGSGPRPTSIETIRAHGLALADNVRGQSLMDGVMLVPDGVAKITLRPIRVTNARVRIDPRRFGTSTATVQDNVAAFRLTLPTVAIPRSPSGMFSPSAVAQVTWFDAGGNVIRHTTTNLDVLIKVLGN